MRPIVSIITALAVNLHLVLGCCAHHAHSETVQPAGDAVCSHSCSHGHHDAPAADSPGPNLPPHNDCHESHCAFMIADAVSFCPDLAVAYAAFPVEPTAGEIALLHRMTPRDRGDPFELAVRPHLLHQSFLN